MHTVKRLREILGPTPTPAAGSVLSVAANGLTVATAQGVREVRLLPGDVTGYRPGDTVRLSGDAVIGKRRTVTDYYVV